MSTPRIFAIVVLTVCTVLSTGVVSGAVQLRCGLLTTPRQQQKDTRGLTSISFSRFTLRGGSGAGKDKMWICVHNVESNAVTMAWEKVQDAECYEVQLKIGAGDDEEFKTVSDTLSSTMVSANTVPLVLS